MITDYINLTASSFPFPLVTGKDFIADEDDSGEDKTVGSGWVLRKKTMPTTGIPKSLEKRINEVSKTSKNKFDDLEVLRDQSGYVPIELSPVLVEHNTVLLGRLNKKDNSDLVCYINPHYFKTFSAMYPNAEWFGKSPTDAMFIKENNEILAIVLPVEIHGDISGYITTQMSIEDTITDLVTDRLLASSGKK